ncbi:hypothetical protein [Kitasatospora sp. NBC_01300]|uniref:hypothetical protein n=1 Tax=Kitasatospora sp. NBC_01300 TaxID=2903574 RepID=UPI002F917FE6|nr:hypothetical protein OG556_39905 [Kitasatospora sp. NBC_01300]
MTVAQARKAIGEAVSARITELFEADLARMLGSRIGEIYAKTWKGSSLPGHNPSAVPPVPTAVVVSDPAWSKPGVIFTWKSEREEAPHFRINTPPAWTTRIAHRGWAVIDGLPVTAVLEWDDDRRPVLIQTVELDGHFDNSIHGWRAWASNAVRTVDWTDPDHPATAPQQQSAR